ncbi:Hpt domain-containing protein [Hydrogenophaga sp. OTU3427]|uniref:Hpt domain-containing protein n=1 Tax=Hydrogenophaga sp. OTU3427 TaxID=3043856 RepID=UPI00313DC445
MMQLIDHATLNELREALGDELDSIVQLYVDGLPEQSQALVRLLAAQDLPTLRRSAHSLKGSSVSMGAQALGTLSAQIEKLAATGSLSDELRAEVARVPALAADTEQALRESGWVRS